MYINGAAQCIDSWNRRKVLIITFLLVGSFFYSQPGLSRTQTKHLAYFFSKTKQKRRIYLSLVR